MDSTSSSKGDESKHQQQLESSTAVVTITTTKEGAGGGEDNHGNYLSRRDSFSQHQGFWYDSIILQNVKSVQEQFRGEPGDILLCSFPKSGTTWLKSLAFAITTRDQYNNNTADKNPLLSMSSHDCVPFIELDTKAFNINLEFLRLGGEDQHCGRLLATHIPYTSLPTSLLANSKIIYICRDPKDVLVSLWHFVCKLRGPISFNSMLELFCQGMVNYGSYWDHVLTYWRASMEHPRNVMVLKYEDLKRNTFSFVKKIAEFMRCPFSLEEDKAGAVEKIVTLCSFEKISTLDVNTSGKRKGSVARGVPLDNKLLFRKGEVGDWKNHLSPQMKERLDLITSEKFEGYNIYCNEAPV